MLEAFEYPATLARDSAGRILVTFPDLPEALTDGADEAEALLEAADCLGVAIAGRLSDGRPVPAPSRPTAGQRLVAPRPETALKIALRLAMTEAGISISGLARALDLDEKEARRMIDYAHATKLPRLTEALRVLGYGVGVTFRKVA